MKRKISLHYGEDFIDFEIPDEKISWIASPSKLDPISNIDESIRHAIQNPIECDTIEKLVKTYGKKTVIIVDDFTRVTPVDKILPIVIEELNNTGVDDKDITILIALGTHRLMTEEECINKVGKKIYDRIKIENHIWDDLDAMVYIGDTPSGIPIRINKLYYESEISIAIGNVIPHIYAGWSAGAKLIQPGVSGAETTAKTHLVAASNAASILGNAENSVRHEMEEIAVNTGLKMIINTVLNVDESLAGIFAGDVVKAHRACVNVAEKIYAVEVNERPGLVICSSYPAYYDLWQSVKPMTVAATLVKNQGYVILLSPSPEGDCPGHPEFVGLGVRTIDELNKMIREGVIEDEVAATVNMTVAAVREMAQIIVVTEPQNKVHVETLGLRYAKDIDEAINLVKLNEVESVGIITHGADLAKKYNC